jgi:hypothetical protein
MTHRAARTVLVVVDLLIAVSAIGGGAAILAGWVLMPLAWLHGTPFTSYTIPALVLLLVVGGSSLAAAVTEVAQPILGALVSFAAGFILVGWIAEEVAMLGLGSFLQPMMLVVGLVTIGLAAHLWTVAQREHWARRRPFHRHHAA